VLKSSVSLHLRGRPGSSRSQSGVRRRFLAVPLIGALTAVASLVAPALASAESQPPSTHAFPRPTFKNLSAEPQGGQALVIGTVAPGSGHVGGTVTVFARAVAETGAFKRVASAPLATSQGNFAALAPLAAGSWEVMVKFRDGQQVVTATSRTVKVTIGAKPASSITITSLKVKGKRFTLVGSTLPPGESGAKIQLLMLNTAPGTPARFVVFGSTSFGTGKTGVTFRGLSRIPMRWELQLEYIRPGEAPSFSGLTAVAVK